MHIRTNSKSVVMNEIKALIAGMIFEVLNDPDFGLELSEKAKSRLRRARMQKTKTVPLFEIKKRYALA
ncbi:MAG: hypothetical protein HY007_00790 [Candidatus Sungbacteria bacterium]|nr:hypothetical protein [Candidatus Sungbacteria bacterium]